MFEHASSLRGWLLPLACALVILGAKFALIERAGSDLPLMDQWDAEGERLLRPWLEHRLTWAQLVEPHNEHRIVTTRLFTLGVAKVNGQWDALVEMTLAAVVHAAFALVLLALGSRWLRSGWQLAGAALLLLLFSLPFDWENTLNGFQVQFYSLLLFSTLHLWFTLENDAWSTRWAVGQVAGLLALASMGSGFVSSCGVLVALAVRAVEVRRLSRQQLASAAIALALTVAGVVTRVVVPGHEPLKAHGIADFAVSLLRLVSWPLVLPVVAIPAIVYVVARLREGRSRTSDPVLIGLIVWLGLNCVALAQARGANGQVLSSRYLDLLAVCVWLSFVLLHRVTAGRGRIALAVAWFIAIGAGLMQQSWEHERNFISALPAQHREQESHVRNYLFTGDDAELDGRRWPEIPYPDAHVLRSRLDSPTLRAVLPPSVRLPVRLRASSEPVPRVPPALEPNPFVVAVSTWPAPEAAREIWRSRLAPDLTLRTLRFRVAGELQPGDPALSILVHGTRDDERLEPDTSPGERWKNLNLVRPAGEWWLELRSSDPHRWIAIAEPVELGRLRRPVEKLLKLHTPLLAVGLLLFLAAALTLPRPLRPRDGVSADGI